MKILIYFAGNINEPKGTPIRTRTILNNLTANGAEVYFAGHYMPSDIALMGKIKAGRKYYRPWRIANFIRQNKIDVCLIVTTAGLWLVPFLRILTSAKIGCDLHSLRVEEEKVYNNTNWFVYIFNKYLEYFFCLFLHFAVGVCKPLGDYYGKAIKSYQVFTVGVDLSAFNPSVIPDPNIMLWKGDSILIGYAGNTKWYQGLDTVLSAFAKINKEKKGLFKLLIIASQLEPSISKYIEENNLKNLVYLPGRQPHEKIPSLLASADILTIVRPSDKVTEYAWPSKLSEHLALDKPLIISRVGDIERYVVDGVSGKIIAPSDIDGLCKALLELTDLKLRKKLGQGAWNLAQEKFDIHKVGKDFYNFLLSQSKK